MYKEWNEISYADAQEWMDDACAHEMQMSNAMLNTWVLQPLTLIEILSWDLKDLPFFIKSVIDLT